MKAEYIIIFCLSAFAMQETKLQVISIKDYIPLFQQKIDKACTVIVSSDTFEYDGIQKSVKALQMDANYHFVHLKPGEITTKKMMGGEHRRSFVFSTGCTILITHWQSVSL